MSPPRSGGSGPSGASGRSRGSARAGPAPRELVLATQNPGKRVEFEAILAARPAVPGARALRLLTLAELPPVALPEEGDDYEQNAIAKARTVARALGRAALADDSGLEVRALGGAPGTRSSRYGGPGLDDAGRSARLLAALRDAPAGDRRARFVCVAAYATAGGDAVEIARGECPGRILAEPRGEGGFGYDPIFQADGEAGSMAELPPGRKHRISHRARALHALCERLGL